MKYQLSSAKKPVAAQKPFDFQVVAGLHKNAYITQVDIIRWNLRKESSICIHFLLQ